MESGISNICLNDDENARDAFSAADFFKSNRSVSRDIKNTEPTQIPNFRDLNQPILRNNNNYKKCILTDITNKNSCQPNVSLKRKLSDIYVDTKQKITRFEGCLQQIDSIEISLQYNEDDLASLDIAESEPEYEESLIIPTIRNLPKYANQITVAEPLKDARPVKIDKKTPVGRRVIETSNTEHGKSYEPCRVNCSPREQYSITAGSHYSSHCLIQAFHLPEMEYEDSFPDAIVSDAVNQLCRKNPNLKSQFMPESVNSNNFHDLHLEKLPCIELHDFMPDHEELSGLILSGFINDIFQLSMHVFLSSKVIHTAVDYVYQYLSRVESLALSDLKWATLASVWVASKSEGIQCHKAICRFAGCDHLQLKYAELRLLPLIDFNLLKPSAICFRNRFMTIDSSSSTISHISSFLLDMSLHCYTVMLLPASMRAAAALWFSRLIDRFEDIVRFNDTVGSTSLDIGLVTDRMESVWPDYYYKLTGYHHSELAHLAIKMHVVVLALLCRGQHNNPSVNACYNKYSSDAYMNLTGTYEKFTSKIVYFGAHVYCELFELPIGDWLDKTECESLQVTAGLDGGGRPMMARPLLVSHCSDILPRATTECVSSPEWAVHSNHKHTQLPPSVDPQSTDHKHSLVKNDSGYSTRSNCASSPSSP